MIIMSDEYDKITTSLKEGLSDEFSALKGSINDLADKMDVSDNEWYAPYYIW